jgi:tetratricopeptide (TPR) repeat protein
MELSAATKTEMALVPGRSRIAAWTADPGAILSMETEKHQLSEGETFLLRGARDMFLQRLQELSAPECGSDLKRGDHRPRSEGEMPECPECQNPYQAEDRYCSQCGARLSQDKVPESGGRTQKALDLGGVHYSLGMIYFKKGQYRQALEIWEKALAKDPENQPLQERVVAARTKLRAEALTV